MMKGAVENVEALHFFSPYFFRRYLCVAGEEVGLSLVAVSPPTLHQPSSPTPPLHPALPSASRNRVGGADDPQKG